MIRLGPLGLVIALVSSSASAAGETKSAFEDKEGNFQLADVVVTATKRDTTLQTTPLAITAIGESTIEMQRITNFDDVAALAPGLVFTALSRQESYPSIRGTTVGNNAAGADQGVSVFVDDVPTIGVGDDNMDLFDLHSIEVLRGPQGTLFGRNVTGGAIVLRTLAPSFTPSSRFEASYGRYNLAEVRGFGTGPLIDGLVAGKVAVEYRRQDGYLRDAYLPGDPLLSTELGGVRSQLLWTPSERLKILFGADYNKDSSPYKVQQLDGNFQPSLFPPLAYGPNDANQAIRSTGDAQTGGALLRVDYQTPRGVLTSILGYRQARDLETFSTSADPANQIIQHAAVQDSQLTEELRFASAADRPFNWLGGVFLLDSNRRNHQYYDLNILPDTVLSFVDPYSALTFTSNDDQHIHSQSYALFGEASYAFSPAWKMTLGGRYSLERKAGHSEVTDTSGLSPDLITGHYSHSWSAFTPKATLDFQATQDLLTYLTVSTGFKSGGYDNSATSVEGLRNPFQPEKVVSYELGAKLSAFGNRLIVNAAAYFADYTNLQVNAYDQQLLQNVTANAGVARIPGAELEISANPTHWLLLNGSFSYMDAKYTHYISDSQTDYSGHQIPFDAKFQAHAGGEVHFIASALAGGTVRLGGDVTYRTRIYFNDANDAQPFIYDHTAIRGRVNLHASWSSHDETWEVALWGKNVTGQRSIVYSTELSFFYESFAEFTSGANNSLHVLGWSPPAFYGISVTYKH